MKNIDQYEIGKYIEQVAYFTYKFIVIHLFRDADENLRQKMTYFQNSYINSVRLWYNIFINIIKSGGKELCKHYK